MTSSDIEDERLEMHCRIVREGVAADTTEEARGGLAAVNSCGGEVNGGAGKVSSVLQPHMRSDQSKASQQWVQDGGWHVTLVLGWMEEGRQPRKLELAPESPVTEALVEQWETLRVQDNMKDAVTHERSWLLVNPPSLWAELLEEAHVGVFGGHLGPRKTTCQLCQCLSWIGMEQEVEWCCKLYHVGVAEKESA